MSTAASKINSHYLGTGTGTLKLLLLFIIYYTVVDYNNNNKYCCLLFIIILSYTLVIRRRKNIYNLNYVWKGIMGDHLQEEQRSTFCTHVLP